MFPEYVNHPGIHISQASFLASDPQMNQLLIDKNIGSLARRNKFNMGYISTVAGSFNESLYKLIDKMNK